MDLPDFPRCAAAADFFARQMRGFADANPIVAEMAERFPRCGVDMQTLVDHWALPWSGDEECRLAGLGLTRTTEDGEAIWEHGQARLPRVRLARDLTRPRLALGVEDVALFLNRNGLASTQTEGDGDSAYETALCPLPQGELAVVARRGYRGFHPGRLDEEQRGALAQVRAVFQNRKRDGDEADVIGEAARLYFEAARMVGPGRAVEEFFAAERDYYTARNAAARWQHGQQQALGLGWANHDHHTYRSSREGFRELMSLWSLMGFGFRERFYAGADAGWGAQILEHPVCRLILFCDVDIAPDELEIDYAHTQLAPREALGTIGLWCALHGSSIAQAGMHHLECEFDFPTAQSGLEAAGFGVMAPFTDMPVLKQAFTRPELWPVRRERLADLVQSGAISGTTAETFAEKGAAGSHLEILQRWDGFKGFNKTGVSAIIRETDARRTAGV